jgi:cytochrome c oxidase assembly protein Cox11
MDNTRAAVRRSWLYLIIVILALIYAAMPLCAALCRTDGAAEIEVTE